MKLEKLLTTLFEIESQRDTIINMTIKDESTGDNGIMGIIQEGGAFKVYLQSSIDGQKDFVIFFNEEAYKERKDSCFNTTSDGYNNIQLSSIFIDELEPERIKILYIQDLMTMQPIVEINEFLEP